jgi:hypothetical protein
MDWTPLGDGIWQLPFPVLIFILLATGVLVTKRELMNMTRQMEYFRDLSSTQVRIISDQAEAIKEYKEAAKTTTKVVTTVHDLADNHEGEK